MNIVIKDKVDVPYPEKLHDLHKDLPFLPERTKIEKINTCKLKEEYIMHKENLISIEKVHRVIKFNQKTW